MQYKFVCLNFVFQFNVSSAGGLPKSENILGLLPFYHGYGFGLLTIAIMRGSKVIVFPRFEEQLFLRAVQDYQANNQ